MLVERISEGVETEELKSPIGSRGRAPEAEDVYVNNHCSNVLTKNS